MNNINLDKMGGIELLSENEIDQIGGAIGPLVAWALWTAGGAVVGAAAAAVVHYFGNGSHAH